MEVEGFFKHNNRLYKVEDIRYIDLPQEGNSKPTLHGVMYKYSSKVNNYFFKVTFQNGIDLIHFQTNNFESREDVNYLHEIKEVKKKASQVMKAIKKAK